MTGRWWGQAAAIVLLGLVGFEVVLRIGALAAGGFFSRDGIRGDASAVRILCVGDSHTYGAPLPRDESYPAQLQRALDARFSRPRFEVVNLGVPGVNSAFVANRLERQILALRPHAVVVWVGWNNQWNALETEAWNAGRPGRVRRWLFRSRVFRLASAVWHTRAGHAWRPAEFDGATDGWHYFRLGDERVAIPPGERGPGWFAAPPGPDALASGLAFDLGRMAATAEALSVPILFVNYPFSDGDPLPQAYGDVHAALRAAAALRGIELVDTGLDFERARREGRAIDELLLDAMGPHPKALLYAHVVDSLVPRLVGAIRAAGIEAVSSEAAAQRPGSERGPVPGRIGRGASGSAGPTVHSSQPRGGASGSKSATRISASGTATSRIRSLAAQLRTSR